MAMLASWKARRACGSRAEELDAGVDALAAVLGLVHQRDAGVVESFAAEGFVPLVLHPLRRTRPEAG